MQAGLQSTDHASTQRAVAVLYSCGVLVLLDLRSLRAYSWSQTCTYIQLMVLDSAVSYNHIYEPCSCSFQITQNSNLCFVCHHMLFCLQHSVSSYVHVYKKPILFIIPDQGCKQDCSQPNTLPRRARWLYSHGALVLLDLPPPSGVQLEPNMHIHPIDGVRLCSVVQSHL